MTGSDPKSKSMYEESMMLTPGGVSSPVRAFSPNPLFIREGKGCMITDVDGNEYVDMCMAYGPLITGHACDSVVRAATEQIAKGALYGAPSEPELKLIHRLCDIIPAYEMVRLAVSGTESTMHAIRLARGFTGRNGVVKMNGGFHGAHDAVLVAAGSGSAQGVPGSKGVPVDAVKNTYAVEYNDPEMMSDLLEHNHDIACVIMEPVMGNVGVVPPRKGYLEDVRRITRENDVLLIFDEVITGCRLSRGGAQEFYGVTPDLTTMGKVIGGGFSAGAFGGRRDIMENLAPAGKVYAAGTLAGNPVSAAAGLAQIDYMCEGRRYSDLGKMTGKLVEAMRDSMEDNGVNGCIQSVGSMFSVYFGKGSVSNGNEAQGVDREMFSKMFRYMLKHGVYMPPSALEVEFMSTAHDEDSVRTVSEAFGSFLREGVQ